MEALQAWQRRFIDVLDQLPVYLILLTPDYHVPFLNRFFRDRFGDPGGERCFEYLFQRSEPCAVCDTYRVLKTMQPIEWEWTGPDGRNYHIYDYPFTDTDGSTLIMEVGLDITEHRKAQAELNRHRDSLEELVRERTAALENEINERKRTEDRLQASHSAAKNLLEDAVAARHKAEEAEAVLAKEVAERERAEEEIRRRVAELQAINEELAGFNRAMVDRELRMIELKREINTLCVDAGQPSRYDIEFDEAIP